MTPIRGRRWRGFTLLETLVALTILSIAAVGILSSLGVETDGLRRAQHAESADALMRDLLARVSSHKAALPPESEGTSSDGRFQWRISAALVAAGDANTVTPNLQDVTISIAPVEAPEPSVRTIRTRHFGVGVEAPL